MVFDQQSCSLSTIREAHAFWGMPHGESYLSAVAGIRNSKCVTTLRNYEICQDRHRSLTTRQSRPAPLYFWHKSNSQVDLDKPPTFSIDTTSFTCHYLHFKQIEQQQATMSSSSEENKENICMGGVTKVSTTKTNFKRIATKLRRSQLISPFRK